MKFLFLLVLSSSLIAEVRTLDPSLGIQEVSFQSESGLLVSLNRLAEKGYLLHYIFDETLIDLHEVREESIIVKRKSGKEHVPLNFDIRAEKGSNQIVFSQGLTALVYKKPEMIKQRVESQKQVVMSSGKADKVYMSTKDSLKAAQEDAFFKSYKKLPKIKGEWDCVEYKIVDTRWQSLYKKSPLGNSEKIASTPILTMKFTFIQIKPE